MRSHSFLLRDFLTIKLETTISLSTQKIYQPNFITVFPHNFSSFCSSLKGIVDTVEVSYQSFFDSQFVFSILILVTFAHCKVQVLLEEVRFFLYIQFFRKDLALILS